MFWRVLVFNLILFCTRRSGVLANGQGNKAPIPELLRPFFEDNQVPSDGLFPGLNEDLLEATTIGRKGEQFSFCISSPIILKSYNIRKKHKRRWKEIGDHRGRRPRDTISIGRRREGRRA